MRTQSTASGKKATSQQSMNPGGKNGRGTTGTRINSDSLHRTVACAGTAFHAGLEVCDFESPGGQGKEAVRTDNGAVAAAYAALPVNLQGRHAPNVFVPSHLPLSKEKGRPATAPEKERP